MEQAQKAPVRKKLADGIYEGDLLLLELTNGKYFRAWILDLLLSSDGKPSAFKTDQGMIDLAEVKGVKIGEVEYIGLDERIVRITAEEALAAEELAKKPVELVAEEA